MRFATTQAAPLPPLLPDDLLTLPEVAAHLRLSQSTVRRRAFEGSLPSVNIGRPDRKILRFRREDIEAYVAGH